MFTGIITDVGRIEEISRTKDLKLTIKTDYKHKELLIGSSIACSGPCLTIVESRDNLFSVEVSNETISKTNISTWAEGHLINLEKGLKVGDEIGGHFVTGHVDGIIRLLDKKQDAGSIILTFQQDKEFKMFIAPKGSVTIDGVSLTINESFENEFTVNIIDHTQKNTTLGNLDIGQYVNIEVDMFARYIYQINKNYSL
ncbi:MAG: Riboflavin synthase [Alphaproteobacteria bacterium MarineAlpha2_Bin1]|nr:MAG: Riboflavin synthase [Alphaproteobacteria bacterium MarineAlpha2_Bin1]|tara:strand:- start:45 stop:638 length:594 start_codon:yes stop_codon:yes gene_type:complete